MGEEYKSKIESTKETPYLALTGRLWCVFSENLVENWQRYNGTALYFIVIQKQYNNPRIYNDDKGHL